MVKVTAQAPTNIAIVKYWGKNPQFEDLHVPTKSSLSFTVDGLYTTTTIEAKRGTGKIAFTLNGKKTASGMPEYEYVGKLMGQIAADAPQLKRYDYTIVSENNFPTAAGFASSAAGFAAFAKALAGVMEKLEPDVYKKHFSDEKKLSAIARLGSGSATRSIPHEGGVVVWHRGVDPAKKSALSPKEASAKSGAECILPYTHWPQMRVLYAKVEAGEKKIKSRAGMKTSVQTNPMYYAWTEHEERVLLPRIIQALKEKDFDTFARICMDCSDYLHAVMYGTSPRIRYLNDTSEQIIEKVLELNEGGVIAAYTYDAGPNAIVFTLEAHEAEVRQALAGIVGAKNVIVTRWGPGARIVKVE